MDASLITTLPSNDVTLLNVTDMSRTRLTDPCTDDQNNTLCKELEANVSTPILMLATGIMGNILALVVLYTSRKEAKKTVFYTLLTGLACTDLIGILAVGPIAVIVYANNMQWVGGKPVCRYHAFTMILFGGLTPLLVCAMSLERLLALRFSYFYSRTVTKRKAQIVILACWLSVLLFCSLPLMGLGSYEIQFPGSWCFLNFHKESGSDVIYATIFSVTNIVIILVNLGCNIAVVVILLQMRQKRIVNNSPSISRHRQTGAGKSRSPRKKETETQMVIFLCAITTVFTTCWIPLNIIILMNQISGQTNRKADLLGVRFASINQILDPWLYILLRKALIVKLVKHLKNRIFPKKNLDFPPKTLHSFENVPVNKEEISLGDLRVKVACVANDKRNGDADIEDDSSDDSTSSVSNLIETGQSLNDKERYSRFGRSLSEDNSHSDSLFLKIQENHTPFSYSTSSRFHDEIEHHERSRRKYCSLNNVKRQTFSDTNHNSDTTAHV